jgi:hypothetical protein
VFRSKSGEFFGAIRPLGGTVPEALSLAHGEVFAEDDCGNYFLRRDDQVVFWDHENGQFEVLAHTFERFLDGLKLCPPAAIKPGQIKLAWIDPAFAKGSHGQPTEE